MFAEPDILKSIDERLGLPLGSLEAAFSAVRNYQAIGHYALMTKEEWDLVDWERLKSKDYPTKPSFVVLEQIYLLTTLEMSIKRSLDYIRERRDEEIRKITVAIDDGGDKVFISGGLPKNTPNLKNLIDLHARRVIFADGEINRLEAEIAELEKNNGDSSQDENIANLREEITNVKKLKNFPEVLLGHGDDKVSIKSSVVLQKYLDDVAIVANDWHNWHERHAATMKQLIASIQPKKVELGSDKYGKLLDKKKQEVNAVYLSINAIRYRGSPAEQL